MPIRLDTVRALNRRTADGLNLLKQSRSACIAFWRAKKNGLGVAAATVTNK